MLSTSQEVEVVDMFNNGVADTGDGYNNEMLLRFTKGGNSDI